MYISFSFQKYILKIDRHQLRLTQRFNNTSDTRKIYIPRLDLYKVRAIANNAVDNKCPRNYKLKYLRHHSKKSAQKNAQTA